MALKKTEKTDKNQVELTIEVGKDQFAPALERAYKKNVGRMSIPGFRKGKAPRKMIEKIYGEEVFFEDAVNDTYPAAYSAAVDEAGIEPVAQAEISMETEITNEGYTFKATVTVKPEVELGNYKGIDAEKTVYPVTQEEIDNELKRLQLRNSRLVTVDRPAAMEDTVNLDYEGSVDGVPFEGGRAEGQNLKIGSGSFIPGFEDQLCGLKAGEEGEVNVTFPEEYHSEELAGKAAVFKVKINEVKATETDEIDDEFAKDVSEFETLEELKADLEKKLKESKDRRSQNELDEKVMDKMLEGVGVDIPPVMVEAETDDIVKDFEYRLSMQGLDLPTYLKYTNMETDIFRKSFHDQAERRVKLRLALEKIAAVEKVEVSEEELDEEYKRLGDAYNMEAERVKTLISGSMLKKDLAVAKASAIVRDSAAVKEVAYIPPVADEKAETEAE